MQEVVVVSAVRSAVCRSGAGGFAAMRPDELLAEVMKEALARIPQIDWHEIDDVMIGCAAQEGEQGLNLARNAALTAGLPVTVPALTVNRFDISGFDAVLRGAESIRSGNAHLVLTGAVASLTRVPLGGFNPSPSPRMMELLPEALTLWGVSADYVAHRYNLSQEEQDAYTLESLRKAHEAWAQGNAMSEVVPVRAPSLDGKTQNVISRDELMEIPTPGALGKMPAKYLRNGTVTEGNSAGRADGAAVIVLMSAERAKAMGIPPMATLSAWSLVGVPPEHIALGAAAAVNKLFKKTGKNIADIGMLQVGEAFAVHPLVLKKELAPPSSVAFNLRGGELATGSPTGAAGARQLCTLVHILEETSTPLGLMTDCGVGGLGAALLVERK